MKFTIIIPCYNVAKYISKTLDSVLTQTNKNIEVLLINDGSTDNTLNILKEYEKQYPHIKVFDKFNGGVSSARNEGLKNATGDYLYFLDGDDTISSDLFQNMFDILERNKDIDFISFGYQIEKNPVEKEIFSHDIYNNKLFKKYDILELFLERKLRQSMCSFIVKKDIVADNSILFDENTTNGEDQEFQIKCMYHTKVSYYCSDILFNYIQRDDSAVSVFSKNYLTLLGVFERLLSYIKLDDKNKDIILSLRVYALLEYFYVFRRASKYNNEELIKEIVDRYVIFDNKFKFKLDKTIVKIFILKVLFKISHKLLSILFRKV